MTTQTSDQQQTNEPIQHQPWCDVEWHEEQERQAPGGWCHTRRHEVGRVAVYLHDVATPDAGGAETPCVIADSNLAALPPQQARELADELLTHAAIIEAQGGPGLAMPCPQWCAGRRTPLLEDHVDDRKHYSRIVRVDLPSTDPIRDSDGRFDMPSHVDVVLVQHVRESEPRLIVAIDEERDVDMSLSEAGELRDAFTTLLDRDAR